MAEKREPPLAIESFLEFFTYLGLFFVRPRMCGCGGFTRGPEACLRVSGSRGWG